MNRMLIRKFALPGLAVLGLLFALVYTQLARTEPPPSKPVTEPAGAGFKAFIAGSGIIEANTENIAVGTSLPGIVTKVYVKVGDQVKAGDPLFQVDDRETKAALAVKESELATAKSSVAEAGASLRDIENQLQIAQTLVEKQVATKFDRDRKKYSYEAAKARLEAAKSQVQLAQADAGRVRTDLDRLLVKAPVDGEVLKLNVRPGEFAQAGAPASPLLLLGNTDPLHVRIDIDENDAWRYKEGAKAEGVLRGNSQIRTPLDYVRTESYVLPKRSLTGEATERVDTRVLQVIYKFRRGAIPAYIGQQMDVFIDAGDNP